MGLSVPTMIDFPTPHPFLIRLAKQLLAKAERSETARAPRMKLDRREAPELFEHTDAEQVQRLVMLIEELCDSGWTRLVLDRPREFAGFVDRKPQIELLNFNALAAWAGYEPRSAQWQRQWLAYLAARWTNDRSDRRMLLDYLTRNPFTALQGLPMEDAAHSIEALQALCSSGAALSLREASARVFQGRSKVLDSRDELLRLLGATPDQFPEAPIQLLLDIPANFNEAIFIENLVTFERMADLRQEAWQHSLLVYAAGFRGSARRLRSRHGRRIYVRAMHPPQSNELEDTSTRINTIENWLFGPSNMPVHFFGDLDYSGMAILSNLREVFGTAQAWSLGYSYLADIIEHGGGHAPQLAAKEQQLDPLVTGCTYADHRLLPLIREYNRFVDQEIFHPWA